MKTQFDLYKSSSAAALASESLATTFEIEKFAMDSFTKEGQDQRDWDIWKRQFEECRTMYRRLKQAPAASDPAATGQRVPGMPAQLRSAQPLPSRRVSPARLAAEEGKPATT